MLGNIETRIRLVQRNRIEAAIGAEVGAAERRTEQLTLTRTSRVDPLHGK